MNDISNRPSVLKLNKSWKAVGISTVQKAIVDLVNGVVEALDIGYTLNEDGTLNTLCYEYAHPTTWEGWMTLPIRPWDDVLHSSKLNIRVPTIVITKHYNKMPTKKYKGKPTREALFYRDGGRDIYTGEYLEYEEATIDHLIPLDRNGKDTYENTGLTRKEINNKKGNKLNSEAGLKPLFVPTVPKEVPIWKTIRKIRHPDWNFFLPKSK